MPQKILILLVTTLLLVLMTKQGFAQLGAESVTVTVPNGGECYIPGSEVTVTWQVNGVDHVALGHRTDANQPPTWQSDFQAYDAHPVFGTSFNWTVPNITSNAVKIWLEGHNPSHARIALDSSNNTFTVSNTCGVDEPPSTTAPQVTQVLVGSTVFSATDLVEVPQGTNLTLVGTAGVNEALTIYVTNPEKRLTTTAGADGRWTFDIFTSDLSLGDHQVDLESTGSLRAKAVSFKVIPEGQEPTTPPTPPPSPTPPSPTSPEGALTVTNGEFPYLAAGAAGVAALAIGLGAYYFLRKRRPQVDQTPPTQPPQIT